MYFIVILNVLDYKKEDLVYSYCKEVITLGLLWMNYYDGIKEGDGIRIMRIWKYLMLIFQQTNHRNYAKETALLLINYHFAASERVATQLATPSNQILAKILLKIFPRSYNLSCMIFQDY